MRSALGKREVIMRVILLFLLSFGASAEVTEEHVEDLEEVLDVVYESEIAAEQEEEKTKAKVMEELPEMLQNCVFEDSSLDDVMPESFKDTKCDTVIQDAKTVGISHKQIKDIINDFEVDEEEEKEETAKKRKRRTSQTLNLLNLVKSREENAFLPFFIHKKHKA